MRAKTILSLCCFLCLLLTGAALFAEPAPVPNVSLTDIVAPAAVCPATPIAPLEETAQPLVRVTNSACPVSLSQSCVQRFGQCALCYCIGSSCSCENRCV
jgi:hypothetical protein